MSFLKLTSPLSGSILGAAGSNFMVAEWSDPGAPAGPPRLIAPLHSHNNDSEAFYVLEGVLHVRVGEDVFEARRGCGVFVPRGTPHTYWNPTEEKTVYLLIMTPGIYRLIQEIHDTSDRSRVRMEALFRKHDAELLS
jgi:mannose-6-phosphate isomerase-like protein (cupin superfamily)